MPKGLTSTELPKIREFTERADVPKTVLEVYSQLKGKAPTLIDRFADLKAVYAKGRKEVKGGPRGKEGNGGTLADLKQKVEGLATEVDDLESKLGKANVELAQMRTRIDSTTRKKGYVVLAFFPERADLGPAFKKLIGASSGLPDVKYNWPECNPTCRKKVGNQFWIQGLDAKGDPPWAHEYVAARRFASGQEALDWLHKTADGEFIRNNASLVLVTIVTDYDY